MRCQEYCQPGSVLGRLTNVHEEKLKVVLFEPGQSRRLAHNLAPGEETVFAVYVAARKHFAGEQELVPFEMPNKQNLQPFAVQPVSSNENSSFGFSGSFCQAPVRFPGS
jgi:hypothetical protein